MPRQQRLHWRYQNIVFIRVKMVHHSNHNVSILHNLNLGYRVNCRSGQLFRTIFALQEVKSCLSWRTCCRVLCPPNSICKAIPLPLHSPLSLIKHGNPLEGRQLLELSLRNMRSVSGLLWPLQITFSVHVIWSASLAVRGCPLKVI